MKNIDFYLYPCKILSILYELLSLEMRRKLHQPYPFAQEPFKESFVLPNFKKVCSYAVAGRNDLSYFSLKFVLMQAYQSRRRG